MKVMMYAMPLFSAYIAYIVPSAVAFYWIVLSVDSHCDKLCKYI